MSFSTSFVAAAGFAALSFFAGDASAAVLFQDDFTRSNSDSVGNGWSEVENDANDVTINNKRLFLRDTLTDGVDAAASSLVIDATGYKNLSIQFKWKSINNNELSDNVFLSWALDPAPVQTNPDLWTLLFKGSADETSYHFENVSLSGADNSMFNLMFWTDVDQANEGFLIDAVKVSGNAISAVPLPAGLPLLAGGLAAFGLARRKRKQA